MGGGWFPKLVWPKHNMINQQVKVGVARNDKRAKCWCGTGKVGVATATPAIRHSPPMRRMHTKSRSQYLSYTIYNGWMLRSRQPSRCRTSINIKQHKSSVEWNHKAIQRNRSPYKLSWSETVLQNKTYLGRCAVCIKAAFLLICSNKGYSKIFQRLTGKLIRVACHAWAVLALWLKAWCSGANQVLLVNYGPCFHLCLGVWFDIFSTVFPILDHLSPSWPPRRSFPRCSVQLLTSLSVLWRGSTGGWGVRKRLYHIAFIVFSALAFII